MQKPNLEASFIKEVCSECVLCRQELVIALSASQLWQQSPAMTLGEFVWHMSIHMVTC